METKYFNAGRQVGTGNQLVNALSQLQEDAMSQYQGQNLILTSHLLPKQTTAMYPSNGRQRTNTKAVDIATLVTVDGLSEFTNDLLFVIPEESPVPFIHVFRRRDDGKNYFQGFVKTAETMMDVDKYRASRLVSALIEFRSDTRPGGNFDISGQFNAITVPYLPSTFQSADHNALLKFKDTPADVRTNVPILDGIAYLKGLPEDNPMLIRAELAGEYNYGNPATGEFWRPHNYVAVSENVLCYTDKDSALPGIDVRTSTSTVVNVPQFSIAGPAVERLSSLCMYRLEYRVDMADMPGTDFDIIVARVYMRHGTTSEYVEMNLEFVNQGAGVGQDTSTFKTADFYAFSTIEKVEIVLTTDVSYVIRRQSLTLVSRFASSHATDKQATIISVRGVPNGVTYSIAGRLNYEFMPGSMLKPDISPESNCCTSTDLHAALRVQEYLSESVGVGHVLTCQEYHSFVDEVGSNLFDRTRHSRYAFLGAIAPLLRTAVNYLPKAIQIGAAAQDLGRDLHAVMRHHTKKRKAALGLAGLPTRGALSRMVVPQTFSQKAEEAKLPVQESIRTAGEKFQVSREFVTVDENDNPEVGTLTISSGPLTKDSYAVLNVGDVRVHYMNYSFGDTYVSDEVLRDMVMNNDPNVNSAVVLYRDQEPLRTLAWMATQKKMEDIYMTSGLEGVSGGSIGFTLEAAWYGFTRDYPYTGSSSPQTGWLPSYDLGESLENKARISRVAIKTVASQIGAAEELGCTMPMEQDPDHMPGRIVVESSNWFLEQLFGKGSGPSLAKTRVETVTQVVYQDNPALLERIARLEEELQEALKSDSKAKDKRPFKDVTDWFRPPEAKSKQQGAPAVRGYPKTDLEMEGAREINEMLDLLDNRQVPSVIPDVFLDYVDMHPESKTGSVNKLIEIIQGRENMPKTVVAAQGLMNAFRAFIEKELPMDETAVVVDENNPAYKQTLGDFVRSMGVVPSLAGSVTRNEFNTALGFWGADKAFKEGNISEAAHRKATERRSLTRGRKKKPEKRGRDKGHAAQSQNPYQAQSVQLQSQNAFQSLLTPGNLPDIRKAAPQQDMGHSQVLKALSGYIPEYPGYE